MTASQNRQRKAERTRSLILEAAALRFAERGYSQTRLEEIGQDVGIGRSAVLYHFKDKQLLYRAVLDELFGEVIALAMPLQPLCREDCPGVCTHCGIDLAVSQCECVDEKIESPFAVLAQLKGGDE